MVTPAPIYTFAKMAFVIVPAGKFIMGSNEIEDDNSAPQPEHEVELNYDFYMARFPVTNQEFTRSIRGLLFSDDEANCAVVGISWHQAQTYVAWLNKKYSEELPANHRFRLPSEAEWEKAARGKNGNIYPWGNNFDSKKCNTAYGGFGRPSRVEHYSPHGASPYDCADMAGNVWEWTRSIWGNEYERAAFKYPYNPNDGREDDTSSLMRVLRGGSFADPPENARCAVRYAEEPDKRFGNIGLRIAITPDI